MNSYNQFPIQVKNIVLQVKHQFGWKLVIVVPAIFQVMRLIRHKFRRWYYSTPPGPIGVPIFGNMFSIRDHQSLR